MKNIIKFIRSFANRFGLNNPRKYCSFFKDKGCAHIDGRRCHFPNCQMHSAYQKVHEMHNHPMTEERNCIPKDMVIVDCEFRSLYTNIKTWYDSTHIVVYRKDFEELKTKYSSNSKNKKWLQSV